MGKELNSYFSKEDMEAAEKNMEKYSMSLIIRDEQIKTTRYYFVLLKLIIITQMLVKMWKNLNPYTWLRGI